MIDLDGYFARTGYTGPRAPTLDALCAIARAHVETIPFENLDVLLGRGVELELAAVERKLVADRRGGYCFEHNSLMLAVLEQLGFTVRPIGGRVRYQRTVPGLPARTHLFLRVELDGPWLVDVGFGGLSLAGAIRLDREDAQDSLHEPRRLVRAGGVVMHQARLGDQWHDLYETTLEEMPAIDREVASWYTSTHPRSHFKTTLTVGRARREGGRATLRDRELTLRDADGRAEHRRIASHAELLAALAAHFGLALPAGTQITWPGLAWDA